MKLLPIVKALEGKTNIERSHFIKQFLKKEDIGFITQPYTTGENILVNPKAGKRQVGVSSHFDVVAQSPGANDNASAIAVCLDMLCRQKSQPDSATNLSVFFFDQEEDGLKGSKAYTQQYGVTDLLGLINLEMVGQGNQFALWSVDEKATGNVLKTFEQTVAEMQINSRRFDRIVTNSADHISFRRAGLTDAFTITCVSDKDLQVAYHYYKAQEFEVDKTTLYEILQQAPLFRHYHKPTDLAVHLSEDSLQITATAVWNTLVDLPN